MSRLTEIITVMIVFIVSVVLFSPYTHGDIRFEEVSHHAGIVRVGESWGNAWGDFNGDGYLDLWATNHRHKPCLYQNNGDGTFTNVIDEVWNANPSADTHGVAWADFDNDGDQDLIVLSGGTGGLNNRARDNNANHLYVNTDGQLVERAAHLGVDYPLLRGRTPLWLDWNGDGLLDVLLTGVARKDASGALVRSTLFSQVDGRFKDVNSISGFSLEESVEFAQLTHLTGEEGLHLICGSHSHIYPAAVYDLSGALLHNITGALNLQGGFVVQDAAIADMNGDLLPDIFLARGIYPSSVRQPSARRLELNIQSTLGVLPQSILEEKGVSFRSDGAVFFEVYSEWKPRRDLVKIGSGGHPVTSFDSGIFAGVMPDLKAASFKVRLSPSNPRAQGLQARRENEKFGIYIGYNARTKKWEILYRNLPATTLVEAGNPITDVEPFNFFPSVNMHGDLLMHKGNDFEVLSPLGEAGFPDCHSVAAGDFDNDMDVDLYLVRSSTGENLPNCLYENNGVGYFIRVRNAGGAAANVDGRGQSVTVADYDRDGFLDLFVTNGRGAYPFSEGPDQLFRNRGNSNNWLQIDLEGSVSNRDGIGAKVLVVTPDGKTQARENGGGIHWAQQDQKRIHFGLAQNDSIVELTVFWPSGIVQRLRNVAVNQVLRIIETDVQESLHGDVNQDGVVNVLDLVIVAKHFGESPLADVSADVNKDGAVNILDLVAIANVMSK